VGGVGSGGARVGQGRAEEQPLSTTLKWPFTGFGGGALMGGWHA
jgi:hypothetical protein